MVDITIYDGDIGRCPKCGGEDLFENGRFYCYGSCNETSGSVGGEAVGPEPTS